MEEKKLVNINELAILIGTEKQIKWATDIRSKLFEQANKYIEEEQRFIETKESMEYKNRMKKFQKVVDICNYLFKEKESAKWWIEKGRYVTLHSICSFAYYGDYEKIRLTAQEIIDKYYK